MKRSIIVQRCWSKKDLSMNFNTFIDSHTEPFSQSRIEKKKVTKNNAHKKVQELVTHIHTTNITLVCWHGWATSHYFMADFIRSRRFFKSITLVTLSSRLDDSFSCEAVLSGRPTFGWNIKWTSSYSLMNENKGCNNKTSTTGVMPVACYMGDLGASPKSAYRQFKCMPKMGGPYLL